MSFSNSTIAVSLTLFFLRHETQNSYSNIKASEASKIRAGEQTFNLHRSDEEIKVRLSELLLLLLYTPVTNACSSRKFRKGTFSRSVHFSQKDTEEILSLRRRQDRYNPDEIDCSTRTRIVRDVGVLLRATIASLVLSQPYIFYYIFSTKSLQYRRIILRIRLLIFSTVQTGILPLSLSGLTGA